MPEELGNCMISLLSSFSPAWPGLTIVDKRKIKTISFFSTHSTTCETVHSYLKAHNVDFVMDWTLSSAQDTM